MKLYDHYNTGDDIGIAAYNGHDIAQSFTTTEKYLLTSIKLKLHRTGLPGNFTINIETTISGLPSGTILAAIAVDGNTLPTVWEWHDYVLDTPIILEKDKLYAITLYAPNAVIDIPAVNTVVWRSDQTSPVYSGGSLVSRFTNWIANLAHDLMFELWGEAAFAVIINDIPIRSNPYIQKDSLSIDGAIEERSTASFVVLDPDALVNYVKGQPVSINDDDNDLVFAGFIDSSKIERIAPTGGFLHSINCVDNKYLADKRRLADSYLNKTCGYIVNDILVNVLAAEGVTLGEIQDGVTLPTFVSNYANISDVLDALSEKSAFIWDISFEKKLYFISRDTNIAPWQVTPEYILKEIKPTLEDANPDYRNRQYLTGGKAQSDVQTESFNGDGSLTTFSLQYPVAVAPEITVNGVTQSVGIKDIDSGKQWYWEANSEVITQDSGGTKLLAADTLQVVYTGLFDMVSIADDDAEIAAQAAVEGSTGIVEDAVEDTTVESLEAGQTSAAAKIAFYCKAGAQFEFATCRSGLRSGQLVTVNYPNFGLADEEMLIESVRTERVNNHFEYTIKAVTGPAQGSWSKLFKTIADQAAGTDLALSGDSVVITKSLGQTIQDTQTLSIEVYACPIPGPTLYPSPTLYPC